MKRIAGLLVAATLGVACSSDDESTNTCTNGVCEAVTCKADGAPCTSPLECCTGACSAGCGVQICGDLTFCCALGAPCTRDVECCTGTCTDGVCGPWKRVGS